MAVATAELVVRGVGEQSRRRGARRACGEWCYYPLSCSQEDRADHGERGGEADGDSRRKELDDGDEMFFN